MKSFGKEFTKKVYLCHKYFIFYLQGYPSELLDVTVSGIPSMHICLDYIPEMLSQPQMDKQVRKISRNTEQVYINIEKKNSLRLE